MTELKFKKPFKLFDELDTAYHITSANRWIVCE